MYIYIYICICICIYISLQKGPHNSKIGPFSISSVSGGDEAFESCVSSWADGGPELALKFGFFFLRALFRLLEKSPALKFGV